MKTYCLCGGVNDGLANFCNKCGKSLGSQVSAAKSRTPKLVDEDDDYEAFQKFKRSQQRKTKESIAEEYEEDEEIDLPQVSKLSVAVQKDRSNTISFDSVIQDSLTNPAQFNDFNKRPAQITDPKAFIQGWSKSMATRSKVDLD